MCLPKNKIAVFLNNEQAIYAAIKAQQEQSEQYEIVSEVKKTHTVRSGEKLSTIARKYGVTVEDLKTWNYVGKKGIRPGKKLTVYVREQRPIAKKKIDVTNNTSEPNLANNGDTANKQLAEKKQLDAGFVYHTVKSGESIYAIGRAYGVEPDQIVQLNGLADKIVHVGQLIKIKAKSE